MAVAEPWNYTNLKRELVNRTLEGGFIATLVHIYHIFTYILILKRCGRTNICPLLLRVTHPMHNKTIIEFGYRIISRNLYLNCKLSNQITRFEPCDQSIYHRITPHYVVFDLEYHARVYSPLHRVIRARANTTRENQNEAVNNGGTRNCFDWRIFASVFKIALV